MQTFVFAFPSLDRRGVALPEQPESFGEWLRRTRKGKGLTLEEVADRIGSASPTVNRYETGARNVPFDVALQLADALGESRPKAITVWVAAQAGENLIREAETVAVRLPEGFDDLTPEQKRAVLDAADRFIEVNVELSRQVRQASGSIGFNADLYPDRDKPQVRVVDTERLAREAEELPDGEAPGYLPMPRRLREGREGRKGDGGGGR